MLAQLLTTDPTCTQKGCVNTVLSYLFHCMIAQEQWAPDNCHQSCTRSHFHSCLQFHTAKRKGQATSYIVRKPQGSQLLGTSNRHSLSGSPREVQSQDMHLNPECSSPVQQRYQADCFFTCCHAAGVVGNSSTHIAIAVGLQNAVVCKQHRSLSLGEHQKQHQTATLHVCYSMHDILQFVQPVANHVGMD